MRKISLDINKNFIYIYHYKIPDHLTIQTIRSLISSLPERDHEHLHGLLNKDVQERALFSKLLIQYVVSKLSIPGSPNIETTLTGKPFFAAFPSFDFNISHSSKMVICCVTGNSFVGIDIERIRPIELDIYKDYFQSDEWSDIHSSENPVSAFFSLWVRKEALIKADGRGTEISLSSINAMNSEVTIDAKKWYIKDLILEDGYSCAFACEKLKPIKLLNFNKLLNTNAI